MQINIKKILYIITGIGWLAILSTFLFPVHTFEQEFWGVMIFVMAGLSCISVATFLITRQKNKEIWAGVSIFKKIASSLGILLLTAITGVVAFIVILIIAMSRDPHPLSTYGTPIHRPKVK